MVNPFDAPPDSGTGRVRKDALMASTMPDIQEEIRAVLSACKPDDAEDVMRELRAIFVKDPEASAENVNEAVFRAVLAKAHGPQLQKYLRSEETLDALRKLGHGDLVDGLLDRSIGIEAHAMFIPPQIFAGFFAKRKAEEEKRMERASVTVESPSLSLKEISEMAYAPASAMPSAERRVELGLNATMLAMVSASRRINEGNNGAIFLVESNLLDGDVKKAAMEAGYITSEDPETVVKILKVYSTDAGMREANNQRRAHEIVSSAAVSDIAKVPVVYGERNIEVPNERVRELLRKRTAMKEIGARMNCILMEYVRGQDLATYLWKEYARALVTAIAKRSGASANPEELKGIDEYRTYIEIYQYVRSLLEGHEAKTILTPSDMLRFMPSRPDTKEDVEKEAALERDNAKKIRRMLQKSGFRIAPEIYAKIRNTILQFRRQGFVYLDAHERNVMLSGHDVYLIDFAKCKDVGHPIHEGDTDAFGDINDNPKGDPIDMHVVDFLGAFMGPDPTEKRP